MINYLDYICTGVCAFFCILHIILEFIISKINGKKIQKLCDKCGLPVYVDSDHDCSLSSDQLEKLVDFVKSLKELDDGNSK